MKVQSFDSGTLFIPACERWKMEALAVSDQEYLMIERRGRGTYQRQ